MKVDRVLRRLARLWARFWFEPASPANLGLCRALFFGLLLLYFLRSDFSVYGGNVSRLFWKPTWVFRRLLPFPPPREDVVAVLQVIWKLSLALACVGLWTRPATAVAFALGLYLLGLPYNYGVTSHMNAAVVFACGTMALARCGDAWSLDARLAAWRARRTVGEGGGEGIGEGGGGPGRGDPRPGLSGEYTWPVRLVWVVLALVFFSAGVSKLRHSGIAWATSDTFERLLRLAQHPMGRATPPLTGWGLYLAHHPLLCRLLAAATIFFEVGYPLALLGPRPRVFFVSGMLLMLVGVRLLLGPPFEPLIICHVFWVPWDRVAAKRQAPTATPVSVARPYA